MWCQYWGKLHTTGLVAALHAPFAHGTKLLLLCLCWVTCDFPVFSSRIPAGGFLMVMQNFAGETLDERRNRERRELYEQKLAEW